MQVCYQAPQPVGWVLLPAHAREGGNGRLHTVGVASNDVGEHRMWRQLSEHPVPVLQSRSYRRSESDRVAQIAYPILAVADRLLAWVESGCRVERNLRRLGFDICESLGEFFENRIDEGGVFGDADERLAHY